MARVERSRSWIYPDHPAVVTSDEVEVDRLPELLRGFETAVRKIAPHLVPMGWDVTVYGRQETTRLADQDADARVVARVTRGLETRNLSTLSYGLTSSLDAAPTSRWFSTSPMASTFRH